MLLWWPVHICSDRWYRKALPIAKAIDRIRPGTRDELWVCLRTETAGDYTDFTADDVRDFAVESLPYFVGEMGVPYEGRVSGWAWMQPFSTRTEDK